MTAPPARLPRDLQGRLDVILAKPVLRRVPKLQEAIEILVRNAYERKSPSELTMTEGLTAEQARGILDQFDQAYPAFAAIREQLAAGENKDGVL